MKTTGKNRIHYRNLSTSQKIVRRIVTSNIIERLTFLILVAVVGIIIAFASNGKSVDAATSTPDKVCYVTMRVNTGDTLTDITRQVYDKEHYTSFYDCMDEIISINSIRGTRIYAGSYLVVPMYK